MAKHLIPNGLVTVAGQVGSAITLLDRILCLGEAVHFDGASTYTDRSAEARLEGGTAFTVLGDTNDEFYVGYDARFGKIRVDVATPAASGTLTVEYWNGSAWTAVAGLVDGTSGLTVDGELSWTVPVAASWAKNVVNAGTSFYHVRIKASALSGTPTANFLTVNWTIYDGAAGTNAKVYKSIGEDGTSTILLWVSDNGTIAAHVVGMRLYEAWDAGAHTGTAPTPTVAQAANGLAWRKSTSLDAVARPLEALVSRDYVYLQAWHTVTVIAGQTQGSSIAAGKFVSFVAGDAWRQIIASNSNTTTAGTSMFDASSTPHTTVGHFLQRAYTGSGGALQCGLQSMAIPGGVTVFANYPNAADGSILTSKVNIFEGAPTTAVYRGEYDGILACLHNQSGTLANLDIFTDPVTGKVYRVWAPVQANGVVVATYVAPWIAVEYDY